MAQGKSKAATGQSYRPIWLGAGDGRILALIALSVVWTLVRYWNAPSTDLMATWLAGEFFASGQFDQIYPKDTTVYTMAPPAQWLPLLRAQGYNAAVFPFVYPPLWAALAAPLTKLTTFGALQIVALVINPLLLALSIHLAARLVRCRLPDWVFLAVGLALLHFSLIGIVALEQAQPQILVSFLILLGLERAAAQRPWIAGAAMALAAAIKLYPLFFALVWLLRGQYRPVLSFALFGGLLAALSVALAGWPLHVAFLHEVRVIGATAFSNKIVFSIDPMIARNFMADQLSFIPSTDDPASGWSVMQKSALWRGLSLTALLASAFAAARIRSPLAWPILAVLIGLFSPLSWGYHYITAVVFAPALIVLLGIRAGILTLLAIFLPLTPGGLYVLNMVSRDFAILPTVGTLAMAALGLAFAIAELRTADKNRRN